MRKRASAVRNSSRAALWPYKSGQHFGRCCGCTSATARRRHKRCRPHGACPPSIGPHARRVTIFRIGQARAENTRRGRARLRPPTLHLTHPREYTKPVSPSASSRAMAASIPSTRSARTSITFFGMAGEGRRRPYAQRHLLAGGCSRDGVVHNLHDIATLASMSARQQKGHR